MKTPTHTMKPIPPAQLFRHVHEHAISHRDADRRSPANRARNAYERAVIFLCLLAGETEWSDGYERRVDDCFENGDGDAVCAWLLEFADTAPGILDLMANHSNLRTWANVRADWEKCRGCHRLPELALAP
jgi:hypothetical protein